ncbi:HET-domain-containing protein [Hypoxylon sp. FL0890]|nr:HET-domain-containing protein [Hypoxylon sp. FL0890]
MITWHGKNCTKADIVLAGQSPYCARCDSIAPSDLDTSPLSGPPAVPSSCQGNLNLSWPSSVSYSAVSISQGGESTTNSTPQISSCASEHDIEQRHVCEPQTDPSSRQESARGYESLCSNDKIRLLRLDKGTGEDPLHGNLFSASLKCPTVYEAVSYVWADDNGDTTRSRPLYLEERWMILPITKNCEAALRRLRSTTSDRVLWIDAVCINQADVCERSHQVGLMSQIYSIAKNCLVYVGEHQHNSEMAMRLINQERLPRVLSEDMSIALSSFFRRPYFSRTWILQELVLSPKAIVYCGDDIAHWRRVISKPWDQYPVIYVPSWVKNFEICRYRQALDFPRWIFEMSSTAASDSRDKVFAILGLFRGLEDEGLNADYSLSTAQVYTGVASYLVLKHNMRHIIGINEKPSADLPSWVPDWRNVKSTQWKASHQALEQVFAILLDTRPTQKPTLLRTMTDDSVESDLADLSDLFSMQSERWRRQCLHSSSSIEVDRHTGGLLIWPKYLISLDSFVTASNPVSVKWPWAWEMITTSPIPTHGGYVVSFEGFESLFLLRRVSGKHIYRIMGHCSIAIALGDDRQLPRFKTTLRSIKRHITTREGLDPVRYWISKTRSHSLWAAYVDAALNDTASTAIETSQGDNVRSLDAAFKEYLSLLESNINPGEFYRLVSSTPNNITTSYPGAKQLIECIRFWSNSDIWKLMAYLKGRPQDIERWEMLQKCRLEWNGVKDSLMGWLITSLNFEMKGFIEKLGSIINLIRDYDLSLRWMLTGLIASRGFAREHLRDLSSTRTKKLVYSLRLVGQIFSYWEHELISRRKESCVNMTEEPNEGNFRRNSFKVITGLVRIIFEELIYKSRTQPFNKDCSYSEFESMCMGDLISDYEIWCHSLETVEGMSRMGGRFVKWIRRILVYVMDTLDDEKSDKSVEGEFDILDDLTERSPDENHAALRYFNTLSTVDTIRGLIKEFDDMYSETRELFKACVEAMPFHPRHGNSMSSTFDLETAVNTITRTKSSPTDWLDMTEYGFIQSIIDIWMVSEQSRRIMII